MCLCSLNFMQTHAPISPKESLIQGLIERDRVAFTSRGKYYYKAGSSIWAHTHGLCTGCLFSHNVNTLALVAVDDILYISMDGTFCLISQIGSRWPVSHHSTLPPPLGRNTKESNIQEVIQWWVLKRGGEGESTNSCLNYKWSETVLNTALCAHSPSTEV